jgi:hypothetical protein
MLGLLTGLSNAIAAPIDVTDKASEAVKDNALSMAASNTFGDPQMGQRKELVVEFRLGDKIGKKAVGETGVLEIKGSADKPLTIIKATYRVEGVHDYGLKEYVYTSKDLPHTETNPWKLVCQLPYNAQYTAWIQVKADAAGKVIGFDSTNPLVRARQKAQEYTTVAGDQVYEVPEWVSGEGACYTIPAGVTVVAVKFRETGYDTRVEGSFSCNDSDYTTLWQKATRTCYLCMRSSYMDCPDRERTEWLGDAVLEMEECFYAFDTSSHNLARKFILSGQIGMLAGQNLIARGEYGDWTYYLHTGDLETLKSIYPKTKKYLDLYNIGANGLPDHRLMTADAVDVNEWYDWGTGKQDVNVLQVAEYFGALSALKKMAQAVGHAEDIPAMDAKLDSIRKNFDRVFCKEDGYRSGTDLDERANAMAVCAGLADSSKWNVITSLLGTNGNCGPNFERWVMEALCVMGRQENALLRMANRYRGQIDASFTTLWEYMERAFDIRKGTDSVNYVTLNHAWNIPNTILSKYIAGVAPESPGWTTYHVLPQEAFLTSIDTTVPTVQGQVAVSIRKSASKYSLSLTSPSNTTAIVGIPKSSFTKLDSIAVNGAAIWKGSYVGKVEGVLFNGEDAKYVTFKVKPGTWNFVGQGGVKMTTPKQPAATEKPGVKLNKKPWSVSASTDHQTYESGPWGNQMMTVDASAANAIDGDHWTGWRTMTDQVPGQWFAIDMKQRQSFNKIVMDNVWAIYDSPAGYAIYVSDDNTNWGTAVATGTGERWGITTAKFPTKTGRYIKIEQTGTKNQVWSIFELDVWRM